MLARLDTLRAPSPNTRPDNAVRLLKWEVTLLSRTKRLAAIAILPLAFAISFAGTAQAFAGSLNLDNGTGHFSGSWEFYPAGTGNGGMHVWGSVCDDSEDGNGVYGEAKVMGYDWGTNRGDANGAASGCGSENREFSDPAANITQYGWYQVCTDDLGSDTCRSSSRLNR